MSRPPPGPGQAQPPMMKQGKELAQILNNLDNLVTLAANDKLNIQQKNQLRQIIAANVNDIVVRALGQNKPNPLRRGFLNSVADPSRAWEHGEALLTPAEFERRVSNAEAEAKAKIKDVKEKQQQKGNQQAARPAAAGPSTPASASVSSPAAGPVQPQKQQGSSQPSTPAVRTGGTASPAPPTAQQARQPAPPPISPPAGPSSVKTASNPPSGAPSPVPGPSATGSAAATPPAQASHAQPPASGAAPTMPGPSAAVPPNIRPAPARPPGNLPMPPRQQLGPPGPAPQQQQQQVNRQNPPPGLFTPDEMRHLANTLNKAAREARLAADPEFRAKFNASVSYYSGRSNMAQSGGGGGDPAAQNPKPVQGQPQSTQPSGPAMPRPPPPSGPPPPQAGQPAGPPTAGPPPGPPPTQGPPTTAFPSSHPGNPFTQVPPLPPPPIIPQIPPAPVESQAHRRKRKLKEYVSDLAPGLEIEEGIDEIVNDTLDMFVVEVSRGAALLAKHRRSDTVDPKDMAMYLDQVYGITVPGFDVHVPVRQHTAAEEKRKGKVVAPRAAKRLLAGAASGSGPPAGGDTAP